MSNILTEDFYESEFIEWLENIGWEYKFGPDIAHDGVEAERSSYKDVILKDRFIRTQLNINPSITINDAEKIYYKISQLGEQDLMKANKLFHDFMINGVKQEIENVDGTRKHEIIKLIDFDDINKNNFLVVNQFTVEHNSGAGSRRPDLVLFVNGIPLIVIELKNPADIDATIWDAYEQIQTYKEQITKLFYYNQALVIADGFDARIGTVSSGKERYLKWRKNDGLALDPNGQFGHSKTLAEGVFSKRNLLNLINYYISFVATNPSVKIFPGYHQYYAVEKAYVRAIRAYKEKSGKGGLMWHTQGSGKSYEMACLAGRIVRSLELSNPTVIVLTDRNNLDDQLFDNFNDANELIRQDPIPIESREELRDCLIGKSHGGIIFTTIQKFQPKDEESIFPILSKRENIFIFADEAHRTQYGYKSTIKRGRLKAGYAQHLRDALPNAKFFAFTGTPVSSEDKDTRRVFGDEIDIYDMIQSNEDGATVPIYYESRIIKVGMSEEKIKEINNIVEVLLEDEEESVANTEKNKWSDLENIVGSDARINEIATEIIDHFQNRCSSPEMEDGKAIIVGMTRNICVKLYDAIVKIKPEWHDKDHNKGLIKVIFHANSADKENIRPHIYTKQQKKDLQNRFKNPEDKLKLVIVRDMWLTGYDSAPCNTIYIDKPMKEHNLMQAIARVNRVFKDKTGGLVVDFIGIGAELKEALSQYTKISKKEPGVFDIEEAENVFIEKLGIVRGVIHGCITTSFKSNPQKNIAKIGNFVLGLDDGKKRFCDASASLSKAYSLVSSSEVAVKNRDEVAVYSYVRVMLTKNDSTTARISMEENDLIVKQALSKGIVSEGMVDIFSIAGLERPNIGLLSEEFLKEIRTMTQKNLAIEVLNRLLNNEIKSKFRRNITQSTLYSEKLKEVLNRYAKRGLDTFEIIEELINLAREINEKINTGNSDGLSENEIAFYDALEQNAEAVKMMEHEELIKLARELTEKVKKNIKVDWSVRESTRASLRRMVKDLLDKYGYPPDYSTEAVESIIRQAEAITDEVLTNGASAFDK